MAALSVDVDCSFLWNAAHSSKSCTDFQVNLLRWNRELSRRRLRQDRQFTGPEVTVSDQSLSGDEKRVSGRRGVAQSRSRAPKCDHSDGAYMASLQMTALRQHLPFYKSSFGELGLGTRTPSTVCQHERAHLPGGGFTGIAATRRLKVQSRRTARVLQDRNSLLLVSVAQEFVNWA
jgi:hypothetical protein